MPRTFLRENVYTANMGGVDTADQLRWYYAGRQSRKWYKYLFWFSFNLAACIAYILESESCVKRAQDLFRLELGKRLIGNFNSRKWPASYALLLVSRAPLTHISTKMEGRKRQCVNCKAKGKKTPENYPIETKFICQQCGVALCQDQCFRDYHTEIWFTSLPWIFKFFFDRRDSYLQCESRVYFYII